MDKKVTTTVALGDTVALLNYIRKIDEEESLKIILVMVCILYVPSQQNYKVLYTREKISHSQFENFLCIQGERWPSQLFMDSEKPSSSENKAFTFAFVLKL